ncbi:hypothetical protein FA95DRAFT_1613440 [Auriscalpium vulgare]|uniref:Uncharacterized protein n=1 Tax=Auriscalpium vulgare TaxID=40419 RepID=A0ACB8R2L3_9AGAM|nr:hypothetical protein FA95DRAFT_1613440 [Auriscalpium vulgare]
MFVDSFSEQEWHGILDIARNLDVIYASRGAAVALSSALLPARALRLASVPASQLRTLVLRDIAFISGHNANGDIDRPGLPSVLLAACITARAKAGSVLAHLDVTECSTVSMDDVKRLEQAVPGIYVARRIKRDIRHYQVWVGRDDGHFVQENRWESIYPP